MLIEEYAYLSCNNHTLYIACVLSDYNFFEGSKTMGYLLDELRTEILLVLCSCLPMVNHCPGAYIHGSFLSQVFTELTFAFYVYILHIHRV